MRTEFALLLAITLFNKILADLQTFRREWKYKHGFVSRGCWNAVCGHRQELDRPRQCHRFIRPAKTLHDYMQLRNFFVFHTLGLFFRVRERVPPVHRPHTIHPRLGMDCPTAIPTRALCVRPRQLHRATGLNLSGNLAEIDSYISLYLTFETCDSCLGGCGYSPGDWFIAVHDDGNFARALDSISRSCLSSLILASLSLQAACSARRYEPSTTNGVGSAGSFAHTSMRKQRPLSVLAARDARVG